MLLTRSTLFCVLVAAPFAAAQDHKTWKDYGGGPDNTHYSALTQIGKSNVSQLEVAWSYPAGTTTFNPLVVDNVMYGFARSQALVALDATSGKEIWIHEGLQGVPARGINYWESKDRKDRRLIFSINSYLQEIDAATGKSIRSFGSDGFVDLRAGLGRDPDQNQRRANAQPRQGVREPYHPRLCAWRGIHLTARRLPRV